MINRTRNFRKILMSAGIEDNFTLDWSLENEIKIYNQSMWKEFTPSVSGAVRYIPKDAKIAGI